MCEIEIRDAKAGDENILAYIQTESWKKAFDRILSEEVLERYTDIGKVTAMYAGILEKGFGHGSVMLVEDKPHCMAFWNRSREDDMPEYAELICIHSLSDNWGKGFGSSMMEHVLKEVKNAGFRKIMLWVFEDNIRARRFYEKFGFVLTDGKKQFGDALEVMYTKDLV